MNIDMHKLVKTYAKYPATYEATLYVRRKFLGVPYWGHVNFIRGGHESVERMIRIWCKQYRVERYIDKTVNS